MPDATAEYYFVKHRDQRDCFPEGEGIQLDVAVDTRSCLDLVVSLDGLLVAGRNGFVSLSRGPRLLLSGQSPILPLGLHCRRRCHMRV